MSNLSMILADSLAHQQNDGDQTDGMKIVYLGLADHSVDGRGPSLPKGIFTDHKIAEEWMLRNSAARTLQPMMLITPDAYHNAMDIAEELEHQEVELESLKATVAAKKKLVEVLGNLG